MHAQLILLGTGSSRGIPVPGCSCNVCNSYDPHDKRMRQSALIKGNNTTVLIDCGPDINIQLTRENVRKINGVIITHGHYDHLYGLPDIRYYAEHSQSFPIYSTSRALNDLKSVFFFQMKKFREFHEIQRQITIGEFTITTVPVKHSYNPNFGIRIGNTAYITDIASIPNSSYALLENVENLVIDGYRVKSIKSHLNFDRALQEIERIKPKKAYFTHISHSTSHQDIQKYINSRISKNPNLRGIEIKPAFDGLVIDINL